MSNSFNQNDVILFLCDCSIKVKLVSLVLVVLVSCHPPPPRHIFTKTVAPSEALFLLPLRLQWLTLVLPTQFNPCRVMSYQSNTEG